MHYNKAFKQGKNPHSMKTLLAFDSDGVLRDESVSYQRCIIETVAFFDEGTPATIKELEVSMKQSNDDWERTHKILQQRGIKIGFLKVKKKFQDLYLGKNRDFSGYINDEPWLADNKLLAQLAEKYPLVIISGAPRKEIRYTVKRNGALHYFSMILGKYNCKGKKDGLEKVMAQFKPQNVFFCDDRPLPIKQAKAVDGVHAYGILPPQKMSRWSAVLQKAGAEQVFSNVNDYCRFVLDMNTLGNHR